MEIADSRRYLHAFPRQGGAFEFQTIRPDITRVADILGQSAVRKLVHDVLRAVPPDVEGRDVGAKTPVKKISLETDFHILDLFRFEGVESRWRSEERRVGKECVSTCRSRWLPSH